MRSGWLRLGVLGILFSVFAGCSTATKTLRPPKPPNDEFILPPSDDPRITSYPSYPARVMGEGRVKAEVVPEALPGNGAPSFGAQPH
jgi:hypothetical protein